MGKQRKARRSAAEIIAEKEAQLEALRVRQAMQDAKSDPAIAALVSQRDQVNTNVTEAKKGFGTGPQSFETRRESHNLWLTEIDALESVASIQLQVAEAQRNYLDSRIASLVTSSANGVETSELQTLSEEALSEFETIGGDLSEQLVAAENAYDAAHSARVAYNESKRAPKRAQSAT